MIAVAVKPVRHNTSTYPVGAVLGAPEFTPENIDTLLDLGYARRAKSPDAGVQLVAQSDVIHAGKTVKAGSVIPSGMLTENDADRLLRCGAIAWVSGDEHTVGPCSHVATRTVTHDRVYQSGETLPVDRFTAEQLDLLIRIGYAERVSMRATQPPSMPSKHHNHKYRRN